MEILILLIVLALVVGLILGPVGFFKAQAAGAKAAELERQLDRLSVDLEGLRTLYLKLRANGTPREEAAHEATHEAAESKTTVVESLMPPQPAAEPSQPAESVEQAKQEPGAENDPAPPTPPEPTTLERLRELRHQQQEDAEQPTHATARDQEAEQEAIDEVAPTTLTPTRRLTIEEVLAGKVFVWIGAIALVLTAAFLLKLGFDRNIITEPVRVIGAAVFGLALWCVGEWARTRVTLIAQALCGAAVAVLYASVLAGHNLYGLFGPSGEAIAFGLMACITAAAILLSLRHGPAVAILGMLGGFMLPPVLNQGFGGPTAGMVLYLIAIEVGVLAVTGKRGWFGISLMTLIFSVVWSLGYTLIGDNAQERTLTAMLVLGTAGAYLFHTARIHRDDNAASGTRNRVLGLSIAATCSGIGIVALLAVRGDYALSDLGMLGLVAAGTLILARLDARQLAMPFVALGLSALVLFSNAIQSLPDGPSQQLVTMSACFGGLFVLGGYGCMRGNTYRRAFATMCAIAGPSFFGIVMFAGHEALGLRAYWWPYTLGLAGLYTLAALPMLLKRKAEYDGPIALFSVLSFALTCVTLGQALDHPWFAVTLALVSAAAALIDHRLYIGPLRVAASVVAFVSASLLVVPGPFDVTIHGTAVFNTLLPMYALPAIAFCIIAWCAGRAGSTDTAKRLTWLCIAALVGMLLVLTRDIFQPTDFMAEAFNLYEWSTYTSLLLFAACLGYGIARRLAYQPILEATRCVVGIGAALALIAGLIPSNPLFNSDAVGGVHLALGLLALYILPAALTWAWSRQRCIIDRPPLADALRVIAITLAAIFVGLQIRNAFHADDLRVLDINVFECATYGLAWVAMGFFFHFISPRCTLANTTGQAGRTVFGVGLATLLLGNAVLLNPLWYRAYVGTLPVINGLWFLFGPTILILALLARHVRQNKLTTHSKLAGFSAVGLSFMLLSMFVRHGFSGDGLLLITSNLASAERYAYSLAWVLFGGVLLIAGVITRLDTLRYGSLAVLLLAVGKVFLIDTANLDNLYRVFSFFGLGVTLIALGYLYQRLIFKRDNHPSNPQTP